MTVTIKRTEHSHYVLKSSGGSTIKEYDKTEMVHPDDWVTDADNAGESIHGPYDWKYVDARPDPTDTESD